MVPSGIAGIEFGQGMVELFPMPRGRRQCFIFTSNQILNLTSDPTGDKLIGGGVSWRKVCLAIWHSWPGVTGNWDSRLASGLLPKCWLSCVFFRACEHYSDPVRPD